MYNTDEYVVVRNIPVPIKLIKELQDSFGAILVGDDKPQLLTKLDSEYAKIKRNTSRGLNDIEAIQLSEQPLIFFKPVALPINMQAFAGIDIVVNTDVKPIWFAIPRKISVGGI